MPFVEVATRSASQNVEDIQPSLTRAPWASTGLHRGGLVAVRPISVRRGGDLPQARQHPWPQAGKTDFRASWDGASGKSRKIRLCKEGSAGPMGARPETTTLFCSGRGPGYPGPPAQIPACGFPAPGSCRRSNAIEVRGFGGPCTPNPQARSSPAQPNCPPAPSIGP